MSPPARNSQDGIEFNTSTYNEGTRKALTGDLHVRFDSRQVGARLQAFHRQDKISGVC